MKEKTLTECINEMTAWKRFLICHVVDRKTWKVARAYNVVAKNIAERGTGLTKDFDDMRALGDVVWAKLYAPYHDTIRKIHKRNNRLCFRNKFTRNQS